MGVGESWTLTRGKNTGIWGAAAWGAPCIPLSGCGGGDPTEGREAQVLVNKDLEQFEWQVSWGGEGRDGAHLSAPHTLGVFPLRGHLFCGAATWTPALGSRAGVA